MSQKRKSFKLWRSTRSAPAHPAVDTCGEWSRCQNFNVSRYLDFWLSGPPVRPVVLNQTDNQQQEE